MENADLGKKVDNYDFKNVSYYSNAKRTQKTLTEQQWYHQKCLEKDR